MCSGWTCNCHQKFEQQKKTLLYYTSVNMMWYENDVYRCAVKYENEIWKCENDVQWNMKMMCTGVQ